MYTPFKSDCARLPAFWHKKGRKEKELRARDLDLRVRVCVPPLFVRKSGIGVGFLVLLLYICFCRWLGHGRRRRRLPSLFCASLRFVLRQWIDSIVVVAARRPTRKKRKGQVVVALRHKGNPLKTWSRRAFYNLKRERKKMIEILYFLKRAETEDSGCGTAELPWKWNIKKRTRRRRRRRKGEEEGYFILFSPFLLIQCERALARSLARSFVRPFWMMIVIKW